MLQPVQTSRGESLEPTLLAGNLASVQLWTDAAKLNCCVDGAQDESNA